MKPMLFSILFMVVVAKVSFGQALGNTVKPPTTKKDLKKIIVYGSDTCHYCLDTKAYLKNHNISFTYFDIDTNLAKQKEMVAKLQKAGVLLDNVSLPVVDLRGKLIMNNVEDFDGFLKRLNLKN